MASILFLFYELYIEGVQLLSFINPLLAIIGVSRLPSSAVRPKARNQSPSMLAHLGPPAAHPRPAPDPFRFRPGLFRQWLIGFIFSATGPVAIILSVGTRGGLSQAELASLDLRRLRQRPAHARDELALPHAAGLRLDHSGTVLVGPALQHLNFAEGDRRLLRHQRLVLLLGASGWSSA